jgi:hypothetical protein
MGFMGRLRRGHRERVLGILALYGLLVAINPILHDDLACHLKSPTHCSACLASPSASRVEAVGLPAPLLAETGRVETVGRAAETAAPVLILAGRSPPA